VTAVRVRHENDVDSRYLGDVPFGDLATVIPSLFSWSMSLDGEEAGSFSGQFVYPLEPRADAYFEVIVHEEDL
jgi:hypothetical protein